MLEAGSQRVHEIKEKIKNMGGTCAAWGSSQAFRAT